MINPRTLIIIGLGAAFILFAIIGITLINKNAEQSEKAGAAIQRETNLNQTISNAERANNAAENIKRDPAAMDLECLRNARNPADC